MTSMIKADSSVVLLLSGGLDSIGLWILLMGKYHTHVYPLHLYSRRKTTQYRSIKHYEPILQKLFPLYYHAPAYYKITKPFFAFSHAPNIIRKIPLSLITSNLAYIPSQKKYAPLFPDWSFRIPTFSFHGVEYALSLMERGVQNINTIVFGIVPEDRLLADANLSVFKIITNLINQLFKDNYWQVTAPIHTGKQFYTTKKELISFAHTYHIDLSPTWSCGKSRYVHCGVCFNCIERKQAFKASRLRDNTRYFPHRDGWYLFLSRILTWGRIMVAHIFKKHHSQPSYTASQKYIVNPTLQWIKQGKKIKILSGDNNYIDSLNESGVFLWEALGKKAHSPQELADALKNKYHINTQTSLQDVRVFLSSLLRYSYILPHNE
jgi:7-cyano-7-deazaguanine synthase in queuosine biosynthesis